MKGMWILAGLFIGVFGLGAWAADETRVFTDTQGRSIILKVVKCDLERNQVTVEREDGQRMTVGINGFCKSDQEYVKQWFTMHELVSDKNLLITCKDEVVNKRKEESTVTVSYSGGYEEEEVIGYDLYEDIGYSITFENKTIEPVVGATLEYKIYYEQTDSGVNQEAVMGVLEDTLEVPSIAPKKMVKVQTKTVEIHEESRKSSDYMSYSSNSKPATGKVCGIRGRLTIKLPKDKEIVREFSEPASLSDKKYPWNPKDEKKAPSAP